MVQDEVRWVLETIAEEWPVPPQAAVYGTEYGTIYSTDTGGFADEDVVRIDRDEPEVLETGKRTKAVELTQTASIGVSEGDRPREPIGTEFHYDIETVLNVRIEAAHAAIHGTVDSKSEFRRLVRYTQAAISADRTYPSIEADDHVGLIHYEDARIENEQSLSHEHGDYFRTDFDVRLTGKQDPDS